MFPLRDLVRSHEAGLAFAGAPSRPVVINRSPPLARIVKWAALLAAATELAARHEADFAKVALVQRRHRADHLVVGRAPVRSLTN